MLSYRMAARLAAKEVKDLRIATLMNTAVTKAATAINIAAKVAYYLYAAAAASFRKYQKSSAGNANNESAKVSPIGMLVALLPPPEGICCIW